MVGSFAVAGRMTNPVDSYPPVRPRPPLVEPHRYSVEPLHHYECAVCSRWWSIGDPGKASMMACPHCEARRAVAPK